MSFGPVAGRTLRDTQQRRNLAHATRTIRGRRAAAVGEMPDWEELREAGAQAKDRVLLGLDRELARLESAVQRAGGVVHWARDATEANRLVTRIAQEREIGEVLKVKSITTEEIGLNEALAVAGIGAVETDLAELVLQLSDDTSSHILVPAIHRNRAEIREIFRRTIGPADLSDDPVELCAAARTFLRERFLEGRMAVSGANFAVAETGTVCVVESEGNGRMCLTLPEILVSVMGIEKVVSSWEDMEVFLQLLPRSSTGEPMNPYTSMWTGVRPDDGPKEFHLILLDNGRRDVLRDEVGRQSLRCIRCSACLNSCPVYTRTGGQAYESAYQGPIGAIVTPQLKGVEEAPSLPFASSLCGACYDVCPVKINIPEVLVHLRGKVVEAGASPRMEAFTMKALARTMSSRRRYEFWQRRGRRLPRAGWVERLPGPPAAWSGVRDLPEMPAQTFREWWAERRDGAGGSAPVAGRRHVAAPSTIVAPARVPAAGADARADILAAIRSAVQGASPAEEIHRGYRRRADEDPDRLLLEFTEKLEELGVVVRRATTGAEIDPLLAELCRLAGAEELAIPADLPAEWRPSGARLVSEEGLTATEIGDLDGAITTCALAISATGTIVLDGGAAQGRRLLTLVPDYHLCVIPVSLIVGCVPEAVSGLADAVAAGRPLTMVSGPSATSDIELSRVEGVHGPRELHVLIV